MDYKGRQRWIYSVYLDGYFHYGAAIDENDNLYFKPNPNELYSVESKGQFRWGGAVGGLSDPVLRGDYLYFGAFLSLYRLDKTTGTQDSILADFGAYIDYDTSPLVDDNGTIFLATRNGGGYSHYFPVLDAISRSGERLWEIELEGATLASARGHLALGPNGTLYFATAKDSYDGTYKLFAIQ